MTDDVGGENKTCATCRFSGTYKRPKIMQETWFGDQLMFEDEANDEVVYMCKATPGSTTYAGSEVGTAPVSCPAWSTVPKNDESNVARLNELDRLIAARDARVAKKESR